MRMTDTDNYRSFRQMVAVDPVENAFRAVACLSAAQKQAFAARFNEVFAPVGRPRPVSVRFTGLAETEAA